VKGFAALLFLSAGVGAASAAQTPAVPASSVRQALRIPVRHADPWFIKFALEGQPLVSPELSTIFGLFGAPPQSASQVNGLLRGGKLIVNPTDNSLWWYPD
jgi:hypothetical protein